MIEQNNVCLEWFKPHPSNSLPFVKVKGEPKLWFDGIGLQAWHYFPSLLAGKGGRGASRGRDGSKYYSVKGVRVEELREQTSQRDFGMHLLFG